MPRDFQARIHQEDDSDQYLSEKKFEASKAEPNRIPFPSFLVCLSQNHLHAGYIPMELKTKAPEPPISFEGTERHAWKRGYESGYSDFLNQVLEIISESTSCEMVVLEIGKIFGTFRKEIKWEV